MQSHRDQRQRPRVQDRYQVTGFISSGTYGRVYKARRAVQLDGDDDSGKKSGEDAVEFAIKKFKPEKEGESGFTGISQSATREIALCAELKHINIVPFVETLLQDKSIYMIFSYCEHDLLQMIQFHSNPNVRRPIPAPTVRSIMYQLLQGCHYLHTNWVLHRDLKPANILVNSGGQIKIGDLGLARLFRDPLKPLFDGDKVVVTIWYRAPELLLGAKHYTPAIDLWSVGCIFGELLSLRPMFKGDEAKLDQAKSVPFQKNQFMKIHDVLGPPDRRAWPMLDAHPDYPQLRQFLSGLRHPDPNGFRKWYDTHLQRSGYGREASSPGEEGFRILAELLQYDPCRRLSAQQAMGHAYFAGLTKEAKDSCFEGSDVKYPKRKIGPQDGGAGFSSAKRSGPPEEQHGDKQFKRLRE